MASIGSREIFFSTTFILPEGEEAVFDTEVRNSRLRIIVIAETVEGSPSAQAASTVAPGTILQGIGPVLTIRLVNWDSAIPSIFLKPQKFGQLGDGTPLGYNLSVTAVKGPSNTTRQIFLQFYVGGVY
jgi:hypothetical protein